MINKIYEIDVNIKDFVSVVYDPKKDQPICYFDGKPIKKVSKCIYGRFKNLGDEQTELMQHSNFYYLAPGTFLCDQKVIDTGLFYNEDVEFLKVDVDGAFVWAVNVLYVEECLDIKNSRINYFKASNDVKKIERYAFDKKKIRKGKNIFKIPQTIRTEVYASNAFIDKVEESGLIGLEPKLLWEDSPGGHYGPP